MTGSKDRILTTHVGSMPRPREVVDMLFAEDQGKLMQSQRHAYDAVMRRNVVNVVGKQIAAGVDIPSDGEMSKISYATYIRHRLTGFELGEAPRAAPQDLDEFPEFRDHLAQTGATPKYVRPICRSEIKIRDIGPLQKDITHMKAALKQHGVETGFMNAASPGVIAVFQPNEYYKTQEAYLYALAEVMRTEYKMITDAGLMLQVDCPDLAMGRHIKFRDVDNATFVANARMQVEALNYALSDVAEENVRIHLCWGNYEGPHIHDIPLEEILDTVFQVNAQGIQFEASNPRHSHEWKVWAGADIPDNKVLIPGVLDTSTNFVEHPELVAERIERFAGIVGRERVIAGSDCGFGTFAGFGAVHHTICWAKLEAMAAGARIASRKLWS